MLQGKTTNIGGAIMQSEGLDYRDILVAIEVIKDMAVGTASNHDIYDGVADCKEDIEKFRYTVEYMIDFNNLHSVHYDVRKALLDSFDEAVEDAFKPSEVVESVKVDTPSDEVVDNPLE